MRFIVRGFVFASEQIIASFLEKFEIFNVILPPGRGSDQTR